MQVHVRRHFSSGPDSTDTSGTSGTWRSPSTTPTTAWTAVVVRSAPFNYVAFGIHKLLWFVKQFAHTKAFCSPNDLELITLARLQVQTITIVLLPPRSAHPGSPVKLENLGQWRPSAGTRRGVGRCQREGRPAQSQEPGQV